MAVPQDLEPAVDDDQGAQADAHSRTAAISGNGAVVAFATPATSLVPTATGGTPQVYAHTWGASAATRCWPLSDNAQRRRTTAAVRARHHTRRCVYVFGGGKVENLRRAQKNALRSDECAAKPKHEDAEIETTVFHADGEETTGSVVGDREAVWP